MHSWLRQFGGKQGGRGRRRSRRRDAEGGTLAVTARIERFAEAICLLHLRRGPAHGYELGEHVAAAGFNGRADVGNLYRLLRGLEEEGLVRSEWNSDTARPRRTYRLTQAGTNALDEWAISLAEAQEVIDQFLRSYHEGVGRAGDQGEAQ